MKSSRPGKQKCPQCQHTRTKHKNDKPLSVHYDNGELYYRCFHCNFKGKVGSEGRSTIAYRKPDYVPEATPTDKLLSWFRDRGIAPEAVLRRRIESREVMMPQTGKRERVIAFPYYRGGEVINVKYRTADKLFKMESGAELTFYGLDDISHESVVVVEGELDCLAVETAGIPSVISVPNGTGTNLDILEAAEPYLAPVQQFILAGDADEPGRRLQAELTRRLGPERCWRVEWPEGVKDANDALLQFGPDGLRDLILRSRPVPIEGIFEVSDLWTDLLALYENGRPKGIYPGWGNIAELYKPRAGQWSVITGPPGSGKSGWLRALLVNLAKTADWQFGVFPPEDCPPEEYVSLLIEIYLGLPFEVGPTERMTEEELAAGAQWVHDHFVVLNPPDNQRDLDSLLRLAKALVFRRGINGFVIDPWNEVEHQRSPTMTETQYIEQSLVRLRAFSQMYGLHNWIVAHPTKLQKENGQYPVATLYDVAGSAHWFNKADFGLSIWRNKLEEAQPVQVHVQKVRSRWCGRLGMAELYYDRVTGQYTERQAPWVFGTTEEQDGTEQRH